MKHISLTLFICFVLLAVLAAGCGATAQVSAVQPTSVAVPTQAPVLQPTLVLAPATDTPLPAPTNTSVPTIPPRPTNTVLAKETGKSISGRALWGNKPAPGARVQLRVFDSNLNKWVAVVQTTADANGNYVLVNPPLGDYSFGALFPDETEIKFGGESVNITPGKVMTDVTVVVERRMQLLEPANGAVVSQAPTLAWKPFPGAASYRVFIIDAGTTEPVMDLQVRETGVRVTPEIKMGRTYHYEVSALAADKSRLAAASGEFTMAGTEPTPTPDGSAYDVPPECQVRGPHAKQYVSRQDNYCFLYPARFQEREIEPGRPGLAGPARDKSLDPVYARVSLTALHVPAGSSLKSLVDEALKEFEGMNIPPLIRTAMTIGGEPAETVEPVPGRLSSRVVFVLHKDTLYRLDFWPLQVPAAMKDVEELYQIVTGSFAFLDSIPS